MSFSGVRIGKLHPLLYSPSLLMDTPFFQVFAQRHLEATMQAGL
jgi:hypothetical protein